MPNLIMKLWFNVKEKDYEILSYYMTILVDDNIDKIDGRKKYFRKSDTFSNS